VTRKFAILAAVLLAGCDGRQCVKSHTETRHQPAWVQFVWMGKSMIPIFHAARDYEVTVCDEWQPSK
jgi:hypothetical protein